jgi:hypothetical protein
MARSARNFSGAWPVRPKRERWRADGPSNTTCARSRGADHGEAPTDFVGRAAGIGEQQNGEHFGKFGGEWSPSARGALYRALPIGPVAEGVRAGNVVRILI